MTPEMAELRRFGVRRLFRQKRQNGWKSGSVLIWVLWAIFPNAGQIRVVYLHHHVKRTSLGFSKQPKLVRADARCKLIYQAFVCIIPMAFNE
jgi:hypothetical protein